MEGRTRRSAAFFLFVKYLLTKPMFSGVNETVC